MEAREGIVVKQIAFKESSVIIHVYGPTGLESLLVHRAKKWNSPFLRLIEPITAIRYHAAGKDLKTLTDADILEDYAALKTDLERSLAASHLLELTARHVEGDLDHAKLYPFLRIVLKRIGEDPRFDLYAMMFELKLYYLLGVQPALRGCVVCGQTEGLLLSVSGGGAVCADHRRPDAIFEADVLAAAATLYHHDIRQPLDWTFPESTVQSLRRFVDQYTEYHLHLLTKSRQLWMGLPKR
jgi:DNA repair protein RecO (recombination protein O)